MNDLPDWLKEQATTAYRGHLLAAFLDGRFPAPEDQRLQVMADAATDAALAEWVANGSKGCPHISSMPMPVHLLMCQPERLECARCLSRRVQTLKGTPEDLTCDVCRQVSPDGFLRPMECIRDAVRISGGCCEACWAGETPASRGE